MRPAIFLSLVRPPFIHNHNSRPPPLSTTLPSSSLHPLSSSLLRHALPRCRRTPPPPPPPPRSVAQGLASSDASTHSVERSPSCKPCFLRARWHKALGRWRLTPDPPCCQLGGGVAGHGGRIWLRCCRAPPSGLPCLAMVTTVLVADGSMPPLPSSSFPVFLTGHGGHRPCGGRIRATAALGGGITGHGGRIWPPPPPRSSFHGRAPLSNFIGFL